MADGNRNDSIALINAVIYPMAHPGRAQALFARGGVIEAVGCDKDILARCDARTVVLDMKGKTVSDGMDAEGDSSLVREWNKSGDEADYSLSATLNEITNQFETADINYYGEGKDIVTYLSRNDWQGTWPKNMAGYTAPAKMIADMDALYSPTNNPSAYQPGDKDTSSITTGSTATQYNIAMMRGRDYDDENWDVLLDQISIQEMADFNKQGRSAIKSIGLPETTAVDGPAAWTKSHYKEKYDDYKALGIPDDIIFDTWDSKRFTSIYCRIVTN